MPLVCVLAVMLATGPMVVMGQTVNGSFGGHKRYCCWRSDKGKHGQKGHRNRDAEEGPSLEHGTHAARLCKLFAPGPSYTAHEVEQALTCFRSPPAKEHLIKRH